MPSAVDISNKNRFRRRTLLALRLLCSGAAIAWVLLKTDLSGVLKSLQSADVALLMIGVLMNVGTRFASAERTLVMNQGLGLSVSRWQTLETLFISNFYALLSPGPLLSGAVTVYRYNGFGASMSGSVGSLLASRAVEAAAFLFWGFACVLLDARATAELHSLLAADGGTFIALAAVIGVAAILSAVVLLRRNHRDLGMRILRRGPGVALKAAVPASIQVLVSGAAMVVLARALNVELSLATGIWLSAAIYAAVLLPISIAGLGVREVTLIKSFALLGLASRDAVALSVLLFLDQFVSALIGGALQIGSALAGSRQPS